MKTFFCFIKREEDWTGHDLIVCNNLSIINYNIKFVGYLSNETCWSLICTEDVSITVRHGLVRSQPHK